VGIDVPEGTTIPAVYVLDTSTGKSRIVRGPVPLPADDAGVLALPEGIK
jgi:hypothetical protein